MQTNDNEYFPSAVTDEWNTPRPLTEQEQAEEQKKQTFRTKRHRTAQRAFSLAAPVAVVAVAATVVTTVSYALTPCPVCGKEQCNYFYSSREIPAQILYEGDVPAAQPETSHGADRLTYQDYAFGGVESQDQGIFLEMDGQTAGFSNDPVSRLLYSNGVEITSLSGSDHEDEESGARMVYYSNQRDGVPVAYVELVYLPRGGSPGETETYGEHYLENLFEQGQDYTYAVTACEQPDLWLRAYSAVPEVSARQVLEAVGKPLVLPVPGSKVEVGSSLYMTLPESQYLWSSNLKESSYAYMYFYGEDGRSTSELPAYAYSQGPYITDYYFRDGTFSGSDFRIEFAARDWNAVAEAWNELYRQAPATGHEAYAVQVPLQSMTVNGVTYDVYLDFLKRSENGEYDGGTVWFVPRQQPTCRISCSIFSTGTADPLSLSGKSLEEAAPLNHSYKDVLSLFYPAGAEPDPLPTPEPSPTPAPTPTATPAGEEPDSGIARSTEFTYSLPDMHLAEVGSYAWISSRSWSDYTIEELGDANRVSSLVSPGSGRTVVAVRKAFDTRADLSSGNAVVTTAEEPYSHTELYAWMDSDGTLNWYRNTNGLGVDAYAVIRPEGVCCRYEWTAEGPLSYTVYPDRDTAFALYDRNPLLAHSKLDSGSHDYDPADTVHDYAKYTVGASYATPMQLLDDSAFAAFGDTAQYDLTAGGRVYTLYVDSNMHLLSALDTYALGVGVVTPDYTVFGVVEDTPDLTPVLEAFARLETVDCTLNVNGEAAALPLYTGIDNHIAVNSDGASITANTPVTQENGRSASIPDDAAFTLDGPVEITVRY